MLVSMVEGDACVGETPAAWIRPLMLPSAEAVWMSECTDWHEDTQRWRCLLQILPSLIMVMMMAITPSENASNLFMSIMILNIKFSVTHPFNYCRVAVVKKQTCICV